MKLNKNIGFTFFLSLILAAGVIGIFNLHPAQQTHSVSMSFSNITIPTTTTITIPTTISTILTTSTTTSTIFYNVSPSMQQSEATIISNEIFKYGFNSIIKTTANYSRKNVITIDFKTLSNSKNLSYSQAVNIINDFHPLFGNDTEHYNSIIYKNINVNVPYGILMHDSTQTFKAGMKNIYYMAIDNVTGMITTYNYSVIKATPPLKITINGQSFSNANSTLVIHQPYITNKAGLPNMPTTSYNVTGSIAATLLQGNSANFKYWINGVNTMVNGSSSVNHVLNLRNIPISQSTTIQFDMNGTANYSTDDPTVIVVPTAMVAYANVVIENFQAVNAPNPYPVTFTVNMIKYNAYADGSANNIEFFNQTGNLFSSWIGSFNSMNLTENIIYNKANLSNTVRFWVKLTPALINRGSDVNTIQPNSNAVIYMGFGAMGTSILSSSVGENNAITNCKGSTDSGYTVFVGYNSFCGLTSNGLPAGWSNTINGGSNPVIDTAFGVNIISGCSVSTSCDNGIFATGIPISFTTQGNSIYSEFDGRTSANGPTMSTTYGIFQASTPSGDFGNPGQCAICMGVSGDERVRGVIQGASFADSGGSPNNVTYWSMLVSNTYNTGNFFRNFVSINRVLASGTLTKGSVAFVTMNTASQSSIYWIAAAPSDPNNVTPSTIQYPANLVLSTATLGVSNSIVLGGGTKPIVFTATVSGGVTPYTYNFNVWNTITGALVANAYYKGVSSGTNTFTWQPNTMTAGNVLFANVIVNDSGIPQANSVAISGIMYVFSAWSTPAGAVAYANVTLNNTQITNISQGFPTRLTFNALKYKGYANSILNNIEFFNGANNIGATANTAQVFNSFMEGNLLNLVQTTSLNTSQNISVFVKIPFAISGSSNTVIGIAFNSVNGGSVWNVLSQQGSVGAAFQLANVLGATTNLAKAEDSGANVFSYYDNFGSLSALPGNYIKTSTNPTLTFTTANIQFETPVGTPTETGFYTVPPPTSSNVVGNIIDFLGTMTINSVGVRPGGGGQYVGTWFGLSDAAAQPVPRAIGVGLVNTATGICALTGFSGYVCYSTVISSPSTTFTVYSGVYLSSTVENILVNYNSVASFGAVGLQGHPSLGIFTSSNSLLTSAYWLRARPNPPNNAMPTATFGAINAPSLSTPTLALSNTIADSTQWETLTATATNGVTPYTYTFYNTTGGTTVALSGCSSITTTTCSFQLSSPTQSNSFTYNVVVTDSAASPSTTNSVTQTIGVNSLPKLTISPDNANPSTTSDITFTFTVTGGSGGTSLGFLSQLMNVTSSSTPQGSNVLVILPGGTNTIKFSTLKQGTFVYNGIATDKGTTAIFVFNSINSTINVKPSSSGGGGGGGGGAGSCLSNQTVNQTTGQCQNAKQVFTLPTNVTKVGLSCQQLGGAFNAQLFVPALTGCLMNYTKLFLHGKITPFASININTNNIPANSVYIINGILNFSFTLAQFFIAIVTISFLIVVLTIGFDTKNTAFSATSGLFVLAIIFLGLGFVI